MTDELFVILLQSLQVHAAQTGPGGPLLSQWRLPLLLFQPWEAGRRHAINAASARLLRLKRHVASHRQGNMHVSQTDSTWSWFTKLCQSSQLLTCPSFVLCIALWEIPSTATLFCRPHNVILFTFFRVNSLHIQNLDSEYTFSYL